jgi:hypothetical protein
MKEITQLFILIGRVLCYFNIHNYKPFPDFCDRCLRPHPDCENVQTRTVLFEKTKKRRRRRVAKR